MAGDPGRSLFVSDPEAHKAGLGNLWTQLVSAVTALWLAEKDRGELSKAQSREPLGLWGC